MVRGARGFVEATSLFLHRRGANATDVPFSFAKYRIRGLPTPFAPCCRRGKRENVAASDSDRRRRRGRFCTSCGLGRPRLCFFFKLSEILLPLPT